RPRAADRSGREGSASGMLSLAATDSAEEASLTDCPTTTTAAIANAVAHATGTPQYQYEPDRHPMTMIGRATSQQKPPSRRTRSTPPVSDDVKKMVPTKTTSHTNPSRKS